MSGERELRDLPPGYVIVPALTHAELIAKVRGGAGRKQNDSTPQHRAISLP